MPGLSPPHEESPLAKLPSTTDSIPEGAAQPTLWRRVWGSIVRGPLRPRSDQDRKWIVVNNFLLHVRPVRVSEGTLSLTHTFGLGGMAFLLIVVMIGTGTLLMFGYEPAPGQAYTSIVAIERATRFGGLIRGVHHWSANLLVVTAVLHLLRVFFTSAFHPPRQFNWVIGLGLLLGVLAANFTGYLLPWDQLAYWAITISTGMLSYVPVVGGWARDTVRGGPEIGQATLTTFYALHTTVLPVLVLLLAAFHFWRVRKARGVVQPRALEDVSTPESPRVLALPHLLLREFVAALVLLAVVVNLAALVPAPLGPAANPGMSPNPAKAPWYFMGIQELLLHFDPLFAVLLLPLALLAALAAVPYLRYDVDASGIWFVSARGRALAARAALLALIVTPGAVVLDEYVLDLPGWLPWLPGAIANGLLPAGVIGVGLWLAARALRRRGAATRNEIVLAGVVFLAVTFAVLTTVGVWFRGPGMALTWPWSG
jgi:quinol-cytochrome oxidoreductase complex cytochrome b subunit